MLMGFIEGLWKRCHKMREFKFRAEMIDPGNHEGFFAYKNGIHGDFWSSRNGRYYGEIGDATEFTGLKDKDGNDIYREDICELDVEFAGNYNEWVEEDPYHFRHTGSMRKNFHACPGCGG